MPHLRWLRNKQMQYKGTFLLYLWWKTKRPKFAPLLFPVDYFLPSYLLPLGVVISTANSRLLILSTETLWSSLRNADFIPRWRWQFMQTKAANCSKFIVPAVPWVVARWEGRRRRSPESVFLCRISPLRALRCSAARVVIVLLGVFVTAAGEKLFSAWGDPERTFSTTGLLILSRLV